MEKYCYGDLMPTIRESLENGLSASQTFQNCSHIFDECNDIGEIRYAFLKLHDKGLPASTIESWLQGVCYCSAIMKDVVIDHPDDWALLGVSSSAFAPDYIKQHGAEYIGNFLFELPESFDVNTIVEFTSMKDVVSATEGCGFEEFIIMLEDRGGDIDLLTERFLEEYGYTEEQRDNIFLLGKHGGMIDYGKFIDKCLDLSTMENEDKIGWRAALEEQGAPEEVLDRIA